MNSYSFGKTVAFLPKGWINRLAAISLLVIIIIIIIKLFHDKYVCSRHQRRECLPQIVCTSPLLEIVASAVKEHIV